MILYQIIHFATLNQHEPKHRNIFRFKMNNYNLTSKLVDNQNGAMEQFVGSWRLLRKENFDEFLKNCGINVILRKAAGALTPTETIEQVDKNVWKLRYVPCS